ncbi:hypothetical protein Q1695_008600 [Nippostrongylus brasiliensis]|nr:hypothetical protein Q1695_008600 [Nippostrongylus brasiliensis]
MAVPKETGCRRSSLISRRLRFKFVAGVKSSRPPNGCFSPFFHFTFRGQGPRFLHRQRTLSPPVRTVAKIGRNLGPKGPKESANGWGAGRERARPPRRNCNILVMTGWVALK